MWICRKTSSATPTFFIRIQLETLKPTFWGVFRKMTFFSLNFISPKLKTDIFFMPVSHSLWHIKCIWLTNKKMKNLDIYVDERGKKCMCIPLTYELHVTFVGILLELCKSHMDVASMNFWAIQNHIHECPCMRSLLRIHHEWNTWQDLMIFL